ncbi:MAG: nuclear transport factor 2 family protein [Acidobacteriota bacterium]|nr:nuclear transport factor 2 family protein [Acidobacteriota bacterium]
MKRCPTCNRTVTDPNLSFCIEDGTPLIATDTPAQDADATIVSASPTASESRSESAGGMGQAAPSDWKGPAYQPPPQFPPPPAAVPRKKLWPWVVGFLALLTLVLVGLGVAAAILVPNMRRAAQNRNDNRTIIFPSSPSPSPEPSSNSNSNANTNLSLPNENENANENANSNTSPPTDQEAVLSDLKDIEDEWTAANLNADKKKLAKILADDYVGTQADGTMQGKADYLRDIKPDPTVKHWDFQNLKVSLNGTRATLTGLVTLERSDRDEELVLRFTDKFVWREGRWQAVASEVAPVKEAQN